jgi:glycosyltransferase involved in cell wall biosynthesis
MEMKVAFTSGSLSRNAGGLFESVRALGKGLSKQGVDVSTYGLRDQNWDRDKEAWAPLSAHAFSFIGPRALAWSPDMDAALDEARPDLVALQGLWQYSSLATRRQWRRKGTPYVVSPRGMLDKWALANSRWKKVMAAYAFENAVLRDASCLHALCLAEADAIRAYGLQQRIEVVPNGVDLPEKLTTEDTESTEGTRRLLFLGRIHPKKGLVGALRAWANIRNSPSAIRDSDEWQFVIAGWDQGGHEAELKSLCRELGLRFKEAKLTTEDTKCTEVEAGLRLAGQAGAAFSNPTPSELVQDYESASLIRSASGPAHSENLKLNSYKLKTERSLDLHGGLRPENGSSRRLTLPDVDVVFFGPAFGEEKEALLRSAEAFILPSFSEGLPMSVLEAWSYGLPVVMTPECNLPEGFACGAALEIRSGEGSFQDGMRILIEMTNQERAAMGMRGRRLVEERFTWPKVAAQMRRLYEEVLGR